MVHWAAFGVIVAALFIFLVLLFRDNAASKFGEDLLPVYCYVFLFCSLMILLFEVEDTVFVACTTAAYTLTLVLSMYEISGDTGQGSQVSWILQFLNFGLAITLGAYSAVEAREHGWTDTLRAAEILALVACYAVVIKRDQASVG